MAHLQELILKHLDKTTIINLIATFGVVLAALIAGMLGFFAQWKINQIDNARSEKKGRENQRLKFYIPLLRCLYELDDRFHTIIKNLESDWLDKEHLTRIKDAKGFAEDPNKKGYFIISSIYLIASFFGLSEAIKKGVDTTKFSANRSKIRRVGIKLLKSWYKFFGIKQRFSIFQFDPEITKVCRLFQYEELFKEYMTSKSLVNPIDACKLHKHIQHSIGEMMLEKQGEGRYRVKSFREFYEAYLSDEKFRFWFILIENLFVDLSNFAEEKSIEVKVEMKNDIRPLRIIAMQYWCRVLMKKIASELELGEFNLQTRPPENVLFGLSENLKRAIVNFKSDRTETFLLGIKLNG